MRGSYATCFEYLLHLPLTFLGMPRPLYFTLLLGALFSACPAVQAQQQPVEASATAPTTDGLQQLDRAYGFRDVTFERPVSTFRNLVLVDATGHTKIYRRTTDSYQIGQAQAASILYYFYKGKLITVRLTTKGDANSRGMLEAFSDLYGPGYQANDHVEKHVWQGEKTYLGYEQNTLTNNATVYIWSNALVEQRRREELQAAPKATPSRQLLKTSRR